EDPNEIRMMTTDLFKHPVLLSETIEKMHADGVRTFIELGPKGGLLSFVSSTLQCRPHLTIACDLPNRSSISQLNHLLAALFCNGSSLNIDYLYRRRGVSVLSEADLIPSKTLTSRKLSTVYPELIPSERL